MISILKNFVKKFSRFIVFSIIATFLWLISCTRARAKPNIIFIMADDHAAPAISCYGGVLSEVAKTPNLDRIAKEGVRLDNCFCTNSICTPSRAAILTGQYSQLNGVYTLDENFNRNHQPNVAKLLYLKKELNDMDEKYPELMKLREKYW